MAITTDQDCMMEIINEQQKMMMEHQQKFMEMMMSAGIGKPAKVDGGVEKEHGNLDKMVAPQKCGICGKDGVCHLDNDCWEDNQNADKRPKWHPKHKSKE